MRISEYKLLFHMANRNQLWHCDLSESSSSNLFSRWPININLNEPNPEKWLSSIRTFSFVIMISRPSSPTVDSFVAFRNLISLCLFMAFMEIFGMSADIYWLRFPYIRSPHYWISASFKSSIHIALTLNLSTFKRITC